MKVKFFLFEGEVVMLRTESIYHLSFLLGTLMPQQTRSSSSDKDTLCDDTFHNRC